MVCTHKFEGISRFKHSSSVPALLGLQRSSQNYVQWIDLADGEEEERGELARSGMEDSDNS